MNNGGSLLANVRDKIKRCGVQLHVWGSNKTHPNLAEIKRLQQLVERLNTMEPTKENRWVFGSKQATG